MASLKSQGSGAGAVRLTGDAEALPKRSDIVSLSTVGAHLLFVFIPVYTGAARPLGPLHLVLWLWFGLAMNGLLNLMHECAHWHTFRMRWASDLLGRWLLGPLVFANFDAYRRRHWAHHRYLGVDGDTKDAYLISIRGGHLVGLFMRCLLLREALRKLRLQARGRPENAAAASSASWLMPAVTVQAVLCLSLLATAWGLRPTVREALGAAAVAYFGIYAYGLASLTNFAAALRAIAEHQVGARQAAVVGRAALRNFSSNAIGRLFMGAYGFAEHATHHHQPAVPAYHLGALTTRLMVTDPTLRPGEGYWATWRMLMQQAV